MKKIEKPYWLVVLFGFVTTLGLIVASYLFSNEVSFSAPFGLSFNFMATYYLFSLTFFIIFIVAAAAKMRRFHKGRPHKWFWLSLLGFTVGSAIGSAAFLLLAGIVFRNANLPLV